MNYYVLLPFCAGMINLFFVFYTLLTDYRTKLNKIFLCFVFFLSLWSFSDVMIWWRDFPDTYISRFFSVQLFIIACVNISFVYFLQHVAYSKREYRERLVLVLITGGSLFGVICDLLFQPIVVSFKKVAWGVIPEVGGFGFFFTLLDIIVIGGYALYLVYDGYRKTKKDSLRNRQLRCVIYGLGLSIFFTILSTFTLTNVSHLDTIPVLVSFSSVILSLSMFFAISRYQFLTLGINDRANQIFSKMKDGIIVVDKGGVVINCNDMVKKILSISDDFLNQPLAQCIPGYCYKRDISGYELTYSINSVNKRLLLSQSALVQNGYTEGKLIILQDITDRYKAEEEIKLRNQILQTKLTDKNKALLIAEQQVVDTKHTKELVEITSGTLHNVKNILSSVRVSLSEVSRLPQGEGIEGLKRANDLLRKNMNSLEEFIIGVKGKKLLHYYLSLESVIDQEKEYNISQIDRVYKCIEAMEEIILVQQSYSTEPIFTECSIDQLVGDALLILDEMIKDNHVFIEVRELTSETVKVIKVKFIHVVINLIKNAIEALDGNSDKKIVIDHEATAEHITLCIKDNGKGVPKEFGEKIFSFGFTTKVDGHGFGLHSSIKYLEEMGGELTFHSNIVDRGTVFKITVPKK